MATTTAMASTPLPNLGSAAGIDTDNGHANGSLYGDGTDLDNGHADGTDLDNGHADGTDPDNGGDTAFVCGYDDGYLYDFDTAGLRRLRP